MEIFQTVLKCKIFSFKVQNFQTNSFAQKCAIFSVLMCITFKQIVLLKNFQNFQTVFMCITFKQKVLPNNVKKFSNSFNVVNFQKNTM